MTVTRDICGCMNCKTASTRLAAFQNATPGHVYSHANVRVCREHSQSVSSILYAIIASQGPHAATSAALRSCNGSFFAKPSPSSDVHPSVTYIATWSEPTDATSWRIMILVDDDRQEDEVP